MPEKMIDANLVRYSRAGDEFHYRWAARRCLKLIYPNTELQSVKIEGSNESSRAGEYVIDVAEYYGSEVDIKTIKYFQLKHSTKRIDQPFNLSDLKGTIKGFSQRFSDMKSDRSQREVQFFIVTNRLFSDEFRNGLSSIKNNQGGYTRFKNTITKYTDLMGSELKEFCSSLYLIGCEGDYSSQRFKLHSEISDVLAGIVDSRIIDSVVALVREHALPSKTGCEILCENVLDRFGVTSKRHLFPAPPEFVQLTSPIKREQHEELLSQVLGASTPIIIHASGGVGKSIVARQLAGSLPVGSLGVVYDCFGSGGYRNPSTPRHRHCDGLVQIANEIAAYGYCEPLMPTNSSEVDFLKSFEDRLKITVCKLRKCYQDAIVAIFIDAADNAEMAAEDRGDKCFASDLLNTPLPEGCRIVEFCRTERINLLKPSSEVLQLQLKPFTESETWAHLQVFFSNANSFDGIELCRLSGGNPRVQANALNVGYTNVSETLQSLGPSLTTVDKQISDQLEKAVSKVKETLPSNFQGSVEAICRGLAVLPPYVPVKVLAAVAGVRSDTVKSFVSDLGYPFLHSESSVQFRDEPTESWFQNKFASTVQQIAGYVINLKPLASEFSYAAQVLPALLLQSGNYDELINLALSNEYLPENNPIDAREIRVYRLQFAFKAALKNRQYVDAAKLAFLAGEETAGDTRQVEILKSNIDLIGHLRPQHSIQELAFGRSLYGSWDGSENVYSASLLSTVEEFKGEARSYLRSAWNWLRMYFDQRKEQDDQRDVGELSNDDIFEFIFTKYNLFGSIAAVSDLLSWSPSEVIYQAASTLIRRLIDAEKYNAVDEIARHGARNPYLIVAVTNQLIQVGRFPPKVCLQQCLNLLIDKDSGITREENGWPKNKYISAIMSFAEACAKNGLSRKKIIQVVKIYSPNVSFHDISENYQGGGRDLFLRSLALKSFLENNLNPELDPLMPKNNWERSKYDKEQDAKKFRQIAGGLLPWYLTRVKALVEGITNLSEAIQKTAQLSSKARADRYQQYDSLPFEISSIHFDILSFANKAPSNEIDGSIQQLLGKEGSFRLNARLAAVRTAYRLNHLSNIRSKLEQSCREEIDSSFDERAEDIADSYISLSRAVLSSSPDDSACYFNEAIEIVSKFGDEAYERWEAVMAMAERSVDGQESSPEVAYRFMRCAELIGKYIDREKNFDRDEVVRRCARLHPSSAFTGLSRWRDRDIGRPYRQNPALAKDMLKMKAVSPSSAWALSTFPWEYALDDFALDCIEAEEDLSCKEFIFNSAVHELRLRDESKSTWKKFEAIALCYSYENRELNEVISFYNGQKSSVGYTEPHESYKREASGIDWGELLEGLDMINRTDLNKAIERFYDILGIRYPEEFWPEIFSRIPNKCAVEFLLCIAHAESADCYCVENAYSHMPKDWWQKVSVIKAWPNILMVVARRFSSDFTNKYRRNHFLGSVEKADGAIELPKEGIIDGISSSTGLLSASDFFNFIDMVASDLTAKEASELLEFSLERFEMHMDANFGDGSWSSWLMPPENTTDAFTGFIWAALGSPCSETRWEAAHSIRRLSEAQCIDELDSLIGWIEREGIEAFLGCSYPFYTLHARLYLFISLARVALDFPGVIKRHSALFADYALNERHVLIQKYASEIAKSLESAFPGTYKNETIARIKNVNVSRLPVRETNSYRHEQIESPWHERGEVDQSLELYFGYDFDRYWFNTLGHVFGLAAQQIEELAREVVLNDWGVECEGKHISDPRRAIYRERETSHSHSDYPKTDDYSFYVSYHAMLTVAANLVQEMPVLHQRNWHEDEWNEWLDRHVLTRSDGRWLADRRDPSPLERRSWVNEENRENWRWEIMPEDFLDGLLFERDGEIWLNVFGSWGDNDKNREECIRISSALVAPKASRSLLNALSTFQQCHDYKLPNYKEGDCEFGTPPFALHGWVVDKDISARLDKFDLSAADISFPPYQIGDRISNHFDLQGDIEKRTWVLPSSTSASLICEIWSDRSLDDRDSPIRHGKRLGASLEFMLKLSSEFNCEIIIQIQIERHVRDLAGRRNRDEFGYTEPYCKLYLFSQDGRLRDTAKSYQLGKDVGS